MHAEETLHTFQHFARQVLKNFQLRQNLSSRAFEPQVAMAQAGVGSPQVPRPSERADDCISRIIAGAGSGLAAGAIMGAITANWSEVPLVLRNQPWPALKRTGEQFKNHAPSCVREWGRKGGWEGRGGAMDTPTHNIEFVRDPPRVF